ncbi:MAG: hypothetical protein FWD68_21695 [Alphaproteobacteria bacterium]|nr:hypothetical protein [Alphaproteobacteria bacterium]
MKFCASELRLVTWLVIACIHLVRWLLRQTWHDSQLWCQCVGTSLEVNVLGTNDEATMSDWNLRSAYYAEQIRTSDHKGLLGRQVDALVSAMTAFAQATLPANNPTALHPVITANWR